MAATRSAMFLAACVLTAALLPRAAALLAEPRQSRVATAPVTLSHAVATSPVALSHAVVASSHSSNRSATNASQMPTFASWYDAHLTGRGIWKWNNALAAYQRHLAPMAGQPLKLVEIGVQSGGSIQMWQAVLGAQCHVFGIDINAGVNKFQDAMTTLTIGDQANVAMWQGFYTSVAPQIDALIDDGGHEPHQMLVTLEQSFDHLSPGGVLAIEDIHGETYVESFFVRSSAFLGQRGAQGTLGSVHVYPYVLLVAKAGNDQRVPILFTGTTVTVSTFEQLWAVLPQHVGGHVVLENAAWGPFLTQQGLSNFFRVFGDLHGSDWLDSPPGCRTTTDAVCTVGTTNNQMQNQITGVHIYPTRLVVEVAGGPVWIQAVRKGTSWLPY